MPQRRIPAVFMRGGTANVVVFHRQIDITDRMIARSQAHRPACRCDHRGG